MIINVLKSIIDVETSFIGLVSMGPNLFENNRFLNTDIILTYSGLFI
jgi:hypothetical protein